MGGRSMGGRMTTMVAADVDGGGPVARLAGLVLICYPLHPPGKPDSPAGRAPAGDRRAVPVHLGHERPVRRARRARTWTATIPAPVSHLWIERKGHDLKGADGAIAEATAAFVAQITRVMFTGRAPG